MANIVTTGTLIRQYNAFTGLSAVERSQSGVARAEIVYYNVNDDWPAPGAGNDRTYQTGTIDLPQDFGYVLTDAYVRLEGNNHIQVGAASILRILVGGTLGPQINIALTAPADRSSESGTTAIGSIESRKYNSIYLDNKWVINHQLSNKPTPILYPFGSQNYTSTPNPATQWSWTVGEESTGSSIASRNASTARRQRICCRTQHWTISV